MENIPPFQPEDIESMKRRWPAALAAIYETAKVACGEQNSPSLDREHCFDFSDGIRMVVSRSLIHDRVELHVYFCILRGFEAKWHMAGRKAFIEQCELNYLSEFKSAGLIPFQTLSFYTSEKAIHYWFLT